MLSAAYPLERARRPIAMMNQLEPNRKRFGFSARFISDSNRRVDIASFNGDKRRAFLSHSTASLLESTRVYSQSSEQVEAAK